MQHTFISSIIDSNALKYELVRQIFDDVKHVVSSILWMHQQHLLSRKLISYSDASFSGAFDMLSVFLNVFDELGAILDSDLLTEYHRIDRNLLNDTRELLFSFNAVLQTLSESKCSTLHRVFPLKQLLINKRNIHKNDKADLKQIKSFLSKTLENNEYHFLNVT